MYVERFRELIVKRIENELGMKVNHFIGGSRRFGWTKENSDIDIFMYIPDNLFNKVEKYLISNGFIKNDSKYEIGFIQLKDPFGIVDLNITENEDYFFLLQEEHNKLEKFLKKHIVTKASISYIKHKYNIKGRYIYRLIQSLI